MFGRTRFKRVKWGSVHDEGTSKLKGGSRVFQVGLEGPIANYCAE